MHGGISLKLENWKNFETNRGAIVRIREDGKFGISVFNKTKGGKNPLNDELTRADDIPNVSAKKKSDTVVNDIKAVLQTAMNSMNSQK
ncbi:hypothetical protein CRE_11001 [Caenorhabditis remanei]|uniref:Uncharacterized protein n=1 Tax=Caenorhabditis remanei TaxID=31234 RepID=E3M5X7_CAERE|nr:hypothetical protein CRE_11001 [Caenorhabditis remanei]